MSDESKPEDIHWSDLLLVLIIIGAAGYATMEFMNAYEPQVSRFMEKSTERVTTWLGF